jgi:hypothetical protein
MVDRGKGKPKAKEEPARKEKEKGRPGRPPKVKAEPPPPAPKVREPPPPPKTRLAFVYDNLPRKFIFV